MAVQSKMVLGSYTFSWNPTQFTVLEPDKSYSLVQLYDGAAYFSWGTTIVGKEIILEWEWMEEAQWDSIQTLVENDAQVTWDPKTGEATTYTVEVVTLNGVYVEKSGDAAPFRRDVKLLLIIMA